MNVIKCNLSYKNHCYSICNKNKISHIGVNSEINYQLSSGKKNTFHFHTIHIHNN